MHRYFAGNIIAGAIDKVFIDMFKARQVPYDWDLLMKGIEGVKWSQSAIQSGQNILLESAKHEV